MSKILFLLLFVAALIPLGCRPKYKVDPRVNAASAEARASLTNFINVVQSPQSNQMFFRVLAWFPSKPPFGSEGVWANVWNYQNGVFLGSVPEGNGRVGLTNNQQVTIPASNVFDWVYMDLAKGMVGDFTARAMRKKSNPQAGTNGPPPFSPETNQASAAAASHRLIGNCFFASSCTERSAGEKST
jgi:uncharacterized protein YegJ (DUF2314 family)